MLAARVEPKNGYQECKKPDNFKPLVLSEFQPAVDIEEVSEGDGFVEGNIHGCFDIVLESVRSVGEVLFEFLDVVVDILRTVLERLEKIEGECAVSRQNDGVGRQNDGGGAGSWAK
jgi:hypothetical protein